MNKPFLMLSPDTYEKAWKKLHRATITSDLGTTDNDGQQKHWYVQFYHKVHFKRTHLIIFKAIHILVVLKHAYM